MSRPADLEKSSELETLIEIMRRLRDPATGCPWDVEQDFSTIAPYTIEEAYEVLDAIQKGDMEELREELGDLLLQVVFHSQMATEAGHFSVHDVARTINDKMIRRHPHVFEGSDGRDSDAQTIAWEEQKAEERAAKRTSSDTTSALDGVALALPALLRAEKLQKRAARTGFDWATPEPIFEKLEEEVAELKTAMAEGDADSIEDELGDILFVCANLARRLDVDPEAALRRTNQKFDRRFRSMEALAEKEGKDFSALSLDEQESYWQSVKRDERDD
ncbi:MAG: nucleoside triphosphate pyrophosphohydrolase [Pseudomonadota bacterium]